MLTDSGWVISNDDFIISALNDGGTIHLANPNIPVISEQASAKQFSIAELNIKLFLRNKVGTDIWHKAITETTSFSAGAKAFKLSFTNLNDVYTIYNGDECSAEEIVEGMCNSVWANTTGRDVDYTQVTSRCSILHFEVS